MPKSVFFEKSRLIAKITEYFRNVRNSEGRIGTLPRGVQLNYDNKCNFHCRHCFTNAPADKKITDRERLNLEDVRRVFDQADELGMYEVDIQGGEPLLYPELFEIIQLIDPGRFDIYLTTNGYFLDSDKANALAEAGITRVTVSIDGFDADGNDDFRGVKGAYERALKALENVQTAGMQPYINFTVSHANAGSPELDDLCRFVSEKRYRMVFNCATPTGCWHGNTEVMITPEERDRLFELRTKYQGLLHRDLWNPTEKKERTVSGCASVNILYINPFGDVLPCPYIHVRIGNVKRESLGEIANRGFSIRPFREYSPICLAGENREFVQRYMTRSDMSVMTPIDAANIFLPEDFV